MSKTKDSLFLGGSQKAWNKQFVWPREGPKGRRPRSFLSGFMDILANRGPDIFIQPKGDTTPIKTDIWSNWDSYHSRDSSLKEQLHSYKGVWNADRKTKRYDPHKRQYVEWEWDQNWAEDPLLMRPKFHKGEHEFMARNPGKVPRKNFQHGRPMRFRPEHTRFWASAHRVGDNLLNGLPEEANFVDADRIWTRYYDQHIGIPGAGRRASARSALWGHPDVYLGGMQNRRYAMPISSYRYAYGGRDARTEEMPYDRRWARSGMEDMMF